MSLYVFISRKSDPLDDAGPKIALEEWLHYADSEPDFRIPRDDELEGPDDHSRILLGSPEMAFEWWDGEIAVKNPPNVTIARMKRLAAKLRATVFSETGELFDDAGEHAGFLPGFP